MIAAKKQQPSVRLQVTDQDTGAKITKEVGPEPNLSPLDKLRVKMSTLRERSLM